MRTLSWILIVLVGAALVAAGCDDGGSDGDGDSDGDVDGDSDGDADGDVDGDADGDADGDSDGDGDGDPPAGWPWEPNAYSWDGSWNPGSVELPPDGLFDEIYFDGHDVEGTPSPILPPGEWDWEVTHLLASWRGFSDGLGTFDALLDSGGLQFGWRLVINEPSGADVDALLQVFHGSSGTDILDFGVDGSYHSAGNPLYGDPVHFGDGPDMVRYRSGHSAAARTGSSETGQLRDNDLVIIGSGDELPAGEYEIITTGIHTGPGRDLVFVNNWERAAVDLGNGNDGQTDAVDPGDGGDLVVIGGNARDFRIFGGNGDDLFVWHVDEVNQQPDTWLGPNFFGEGGWGDALWADAGRDRLLLDIPVDTTLVTAPGESAPGTLLVMIESSYEAVIDTPTEHDPCARYYITAPDGPAGERTMTLQYQSADGSIDTAYFYITNIEELQVGVGADAVVYALDDIAGTATADGGLVPTVDIPRRSHFESLMETFLRDR